MRSQEDASVRNRATLTLLLFLVLLLIILAQNGALGNIFASLSNVTPIFCGKPEKLFFHELCHRVGAQPRN